MPQLSGREDKEQHGAIAQPDHRCRRRAGRPCRRRQARIRLDRRAVRLAGGAQIDVRGGGPGTRETALLDPAQTVEGIDAIVLSGGSAFGLDAASGAQSYLREHGRGFSVREALVPIVPGAILFDLLSGGDKNWGRYPPYREFGYDAAKNAGGDCALGSVGAGLGATTVNLKGGIGSASAQTRDGLTVGAIVAVNAAGSVTIGDGPHFWAAPFEQR